MLSNKNFTKERKNYKNYFITQRNNIFSFLLSSLKKRFCFMCFVKLMRNFPLFLVSVFNKIPIELTIHGIYIFFNSNFIRFLDKMKCQFEQKHFTINSLDLILYDYTYTTYIYVSVYNSIIYYCMIQVVCYGIEQHSS